MWASPAHVGATNAHTPRPRPPTTAEGNTYFWPATTDMVIKEGSETFRPLMAFRRLHEFMPAAADVTKASLNLTFVNWAGVVTLQVGMPVLKGGGGRGAPRVGGNAEDGRSPVPASGRQIQWCACVYALSRDAAPAHVSREQGARGCMRTQVTSPAHRDHKSLFRMLSNPSHLPSPGVPAQQDVERPAAGGQLCRLGMEADRHIQLERRVG